MSSHEILDLFFETDDPLLNDIDNFMNEDLTKNIDPILSYNHAQENINSVDFWNSFLRDAEKDCFRYDSERNSSEAIDIDSSSHYSENLSPQSSPYLAENGDKTVASDSYDGNTADILSHVTSNHSYALPCESYCEISAPDSPESVIDIGADVVVFTSELNESTKECSKSKSVYLDMPKTSLHGKRSRKVVEEDIDFFDSYPKLLHLNDDEMKLIKKEGLHIPTNMPLTKAEEKELKRIRRKIRNKHSAQESRQRKKEYVDGLETRIKICTSENIHLKKRVQTLENEQKSLLDQIKNLKSMLSSSGKTVQSTTCLIVLFLSFMLVILPSLFSNFESKVLAPGKQAMPPVPGSSRTLLATKSAEPDQLDVDIKPENINASHENYGSPVKRELFDDSYTELFGSLENANLQPNKKLKYENKYEVYSTTFKEDDKGSVVLNENHTYKQTLKNMKKEVMFALD